MNILAEFLMIWYAMFLFMMWLIADTLHSHHFQKPYVTSKKILKEMVTSLKESPLGGRRTFLYSFIYSVFVVVVLTIFLATTMERLGALMVSAISGLWTRFAAAVTDTKVG